METEIERMVPPPKCPDSIYTFHASANAGVNAGVKAANLVDRKYIHGNTAVSSPPYELKQRQEKGLVKGKQDAEFRCGSVEVDDAQEHIKKMSTFLKKNNNCKVFDSNAETNKERLRLFNRQDVGIHRITSYTEYKKVQDGERKLLGKDGMNEDIRLGQFPKQPAQLQCTPQTQRNVKRIVPPRLHLPYTRFGRHTRPPSGNSQ